MTSDASIRAGELLAIEECDAWFEYLEACHVSREQGEQRYVDVEVWAWARLSQRRRGIRQRRRSLAKAST